MLKFSDPLMHERMVIGYKRAGLKKEVIMKRLIPAMEKYKRELNVEDEHYAELNALFDRMPKNYIYMSDSGIHIRRDRWGVMLGVDGKTSLSIGVVVPMTLRLLVERTEAENDEVRVQTRGDQMRLAVYCNPKDAQAPELRRMANEKKPPLPMCFADGCDRFGTRRCAGCKQARYCSRECQKAHWRSGGHTCCCTSSGANSASHRNDDNNDEDDE